MCFKFSNHPKAVKKQMTGELNIFNLKGINERKYTTPFSIAKQTQSPKPIMV